jgi:drug/metabolite transporter (DMT)-like permease
LLFNPLFQLTVILWLVQFFNWLLVLAQSDLSFAQPMSGISYITVACSAACLFGEHISPQRGAGIALIVIGAWLMGGTTPHTRGQVSEARK